MFTKESKSSSVSSRASRALALVLVMALMVGCFGSGLAFAESTETRKPLMPSDVYANNVNAAVGITTSITTTNYYGYTTKAAASGSGFVYSADGYIVTNYHVIDDSDSITVTTYDNKSYPATVVGCDERSDIAVLKIDAQDLQPVVLGDSDALRVGDYVLAIGNPLGELTFSLTMGIVSALGREVTFSSGSSMALIQTDAAINSGNSGGPLFNLYGEVVGITNAKFSTNAMSGSASIDNIGFAIPINQVRVIVDSIIAYGYIVKPYLGVSIANVSEELQSYGIPQGASVQVVNEDSPAEKAGLQEKDIITAANETEIHSSSDLVRFVSACKPGDELTLSVYRRGESELLNIHVVLGEQQQEAKTSTVDEQQEGQSFQNGSGSADPGDFFPFPFGFGFAG